MESNNLYKHRSAARAIKDASLLMSANLRKTFARTWLPALVASMIGACLTLLLPDAQTVGGAFVPTTGAEVLLSVLGGLAPTVLTLALFYLAYSWVVARLITLLDERPFKDNLKRAMKNYLILLALWLLIGVVVIAFDFLAGMLMADNGFTPERAERWGRAISLATVVVVFIATLPFSYSSTAYLIDDGQPLSSLWKKGYATGFRHWGKLFSAFFLSGLIAMVVAAIVLSPTAILAAASSIDDFGTTVMGDASGLPGYFLLLSFATNLLTTFILCFVGEWLFLVGYYVYGGIAAGKTGDND